MRILENLVPVIIWLVKGMFGPRIEKLWKNRVLTKFSILEILITNYNSPHCVLGQNPLEVIYSSTVLGMSDNVPHPQSSGMGRREHNC